MIPHVSKINIYFLITAHKRNFGWYFHGCLSVHRGGEGVYLQGESASGGSASGRSASGGRSTSRGWFLQRRSTSRGVYIWEICLHRVGIGGLPPGGSASRRVCIQGGVCLGVVGRPPALRIREAGGTHPTGMLSCSNYFN